MTARATTASPFDILHEDDKPATPKTASQNNLAKRLSTGSVRSIGKQSSKTASMPRIVQETNALPEIPRTLVLEAS